MSLIDLLKCRKKGINQIFAILIAIILLVAVAIVLFFVYGIVEGKSFAFIEKMRGFGV